MNYKCQDCGKKSGMKKCRSCGSTRMVPYKKTPRSVIDSAISPPAVVREPAPDPAPEPPQAAQAGPDEPATENLDIYAEIEKEVAKSAVAQSGPMMDAREKCDLVFSSPFVIVNFICDQVDKDSKYKPLADIWKFDEKEINEIVDYVFKILQQYFPEIIEKISTIDVLFIIFNGIAIFMIFGKKIIQTMKFFKDQEKKKKEKEVNDRPTGTEPAGSPVA